MCCHISAWKNKPGSCIFFLSTLQKNLLRVLYIVFVLSTKH
uniref:Uncharacterized protein n=1 Tax=Anguilla anguilla TaxID=7936 RepID=A0A0E9USP5_ANGAN